MADAVESAAHPALTGNTYRVLSLASWALLVVTTFWYNFHTPTEGSHHRGTIWHINRERHTPFALNSIITSVYFIVHFVLQLGYAWHLYSRNADHVKAAADVGAHFIANNLLLFGIVHLWCRSYFWPALLLVIVNFLNLSAAYFRHSRAPRAIHVPVVSGPLALSYVLLFTVGAAAVNAHSLPARLVANVAVWGWLGYGLFFLMFYKDYTMGFNMSVLSASLGVGQFLTHIVAFQWIFAFVIMAVLFVLTLATASGNDPFARVPTNRVVAEDSERAPLLQEA